MALTSCEGSEKGGENGSGGGGLPSDDVWNVTDAQTELYSWSPSIVPSQYYSVKVNGEKVADIAMIISPDMFDDDKTVMIQKGKKTYHQVKLV